MLVAAAVPQFPSRAAALPPAAPTLSFSASPASADPGTTFAIAPAVDVTGSDAAVTLSLIVESGNATGTLACTSTSVAPVSGTATFDGCSVSRGGRYRLRATLGAVTADSTDFLVSGPSWVEFTSEPGGGDGGVAWSTQPVAQVVDGDGDVIESNTAKIGLVIKPGTGAIGAALTCTDAKNATTAVDGVATFSGCAIDRAGTGYRLFAVDVTDGVYATSAAFNISSGDPAALAFTTQPRGGAGGQVFTVQPVVAIVDAFGNPISGNSSEVTLSITTSSGAAGADLTCTANPVTASNGFAAFGGCTIDLTATDYTLTARVNGTTLTEAVSDPFDVVAGDASGIAFSTQPSGGEGGTAFATQPVITVDDDGGNGVSGLVTLTVKTGTGTAGAVLTCDANPVLADAGSATFSGCAIDRTGTGYVLVADFGVLHAESDPFDVSAGSAWAAAFLTQPTDSTGGVAFTGQPTVELRDAGGNLAAGSVTLALVDGLGRPGALLGCDQVDNTVNTVAGVASFTGCAVDRAGPGYRIVATVSGSTTAQAVSNPIEITTGAPDHLTFRTSPGGGSGGTAWEQQPVVAVEDAGGNAITDSTVSVDLVVTSGTGSGRVRCAAEPLAVTNGLALFAGCSVDRAGTGYTLTATSGTLLPAESEPFDVTVGEPVGIDFRREPERAVSGEPFVQQPIVAVVDAGGNIVPDAGGSIGIDLTEGSGTPGANLACASSVTSVASDGTAEFGGCSIAEVGGGYALTATWAGHTTESLAFPVTPSAVPPLEQAPTGVPVAQTFGRGAYALNPTSTVDDVNSATGALQTFFDDLMVAGVGKSLHVVRSYNSLDVEGGYFGRGWSSIFDLSVTFSVNRREATVRGEDGQRVTFTKIGNTNKWAPPPGARATLKCDAKSCTVTHWDGTRWTVTGTRLEEYEDAHGRGLHMIWMFGKLVGVRLTTTDNKRPIIVSVSVSNGRITQINTPTRQVGYSYTSGVLTAVTDVRGFTWTYSYDVAGRLARLEDPLGQVRREVTYADDGRVSEARLLGDEARYDNSFDWDGYTHETTRITHVNNGLLEQEARFVDRYADNVLIRQEFPGNSVMRYSYDAHLNLVAVQDANGFVQQMTYSANDDLLSQSNVISSSTTAVVRFTYDDRHRMRSQTDANGNTTVYEYAGADVHRIVPPGPPSGATHLHHNGLGLLTELVTPSGKQEYRYDLAGNQARVIERDQPGKALNGAGSLATFDESGNRLSFTDARGTTRPLTAPQFTSTWTYDPTGHVIQTKDANGTVLNNSYDAAGTLVSSTTPAGTTTYSWNEATRTKTVSGPDGTSSQQFDRSGNLVRTTSATGATTRYRSDGVGKVVEVTDPAGQQERYTYDALGNGIEIRSGDSVVRQQFDSMNRNIRSTSDGTATMIRYDVLGKPVWTREGSADPVTRTYDSHNNLTSMTDGSGTTRYAYDLEDNLVRRTDGRGGVTTWTYNSMGRTVSTSVDGRTTTFGYDEAGQRNRSVDPAGRTVALTLDGLNQVTKRVHSAPSLPMITVSQAFDWQGRRTSMTDSEGTHTFAYDDSGNLVAATVVGGRFTYDYQHPGKINETYPDGTEVTFDVDDNRAIMGLTSGTVGDPGYVQASYVRDGNRRTTALALSNGVLQTRTYDAAGNVTAQSVQHLGAVLAGDTYTYDRGGNRTAQRSTALGLSVINAYRYDALHRLSGFSTDSEPLAVAAPVAASQSAPTSIRVGASALTPVDQPLLPMPGTLGNGAPQPEGTPDTSPDTPSANYGYDAVGNITNDPTSTYQHGPGDQIINQSGPTTWTYDRSGAVTGTSGPSGSATYAYDAAGRLISASVTRSGSGTATVTYAYDGDGNRIRRTAGGVTTSMVWDPFAGDPVLVLERENDTITRRYFHGDGPVAVQTSSDTYFFHLDPVGSTNQITDSSGAVVAAYTYDAFGAVSERGSIPGLVDLLFQGQQLDRVTGLYNMRARNYDPNTGRFTQREPIDARVGESVTSAYAFVGNRPTYSTDPSGLYVSPWVTFGWRLYQSRERVADNASALATRTFAGQETDNANIAKNSKWGLRAAKLGIKGVSKYGNYAAALAGKYVGEGAAQMAKVGARLKFAGRALSVIGLGVEGYILSETCKNGTVAACVSGSILLAVNVGFTVGCMVLTAGSGSIACAVLGAMVSAALEFVLSEFGPAIAQGLADMAVFAAPYLAALGRYLADRFVDLGNAIADLGLEAVGSLMSGINTATEAIASGFQTAVNTLVDAGYLAAELADVLARNFLYGAEVAISALTDLGYGIQGALEALGDVFGKTAAEAAAMVRDVLVGGAQAVADALASAYSLTAEGVAAALKAASYAVDEVANALVGAFNTTVEELSAALDSVGYGFKQIGAALQDVAALTAEAVATALQGISQTAEAVAEVLRDLYTLANSAAAAVLKAVDFAVTAVAEALKDVYAATAAVATSVLKGVSYAASAVAEGLQSAYSAAADFATQLLKEAGFLVSEVAEALKDVYSQAGEAAAALLKGAGFVASAVASALRDVYSLASEAAAQVLKNINFAVNEVMDALKTTFALADAAAAAVLKNINFAVQQVASALRDVYGTLAEATASILKGISYTVAQVGSVLQSVFFQGAALAAQVLENIGYAFTDIGTALAGVFGTAAETAAQILRDIGATAADIAGILENTFYESIDAIGGFLSSIGFNDDTISAIGGAFEDFGDAVCDFFDSIF